MSENDIKEREEFRNKLNQLWKCVLGNGHPEEGLVWKVNEMSKFTETVKRVFWLVVGVGVTGGLSAIGLFVWKVIAFMIGQHAL